MGSHATGASHEAEILSRLIQPERNDLRPEVAEYILDLDFREADVDRMNELAGKAAAGARMNRVRWTATATSVTS